MMLDTITLASGPYGPPGWMVILFLVIVALVFYSFVPASRGNGSALLLAAPSLLIGLFLVSNIIIDTRKDALDLFAWIICLGPLVVSVASILLWVVRRCTIRRSEIGATHEKRPEVQ